MIPDFYLIRTYSAGVHFGLVVFHEGKNVKLQNARRIWRWRGANTLNELSQHGADFEWTRISEPVPVIELTEAIELILCSEKAVENLSQSRWSQS